MRKSSGWEKAKSIKDKLISMNSFENIYNQLILQKCISKSNIKEVMKFYLNNSEDNYQLFSKMNKLLELIDSTIKKNKKNNENSTDLMELKD